MPNTLQSKPEAESPASDDWLFIQGDENSVRKLSPGFYAPSSNPTLDGSVIVKSDDGFAVLNADGTIPIVVADPTGLLLFVPLIMQLLTINHSDDPTIPPTAMLVDYKRTDAQPIVVSALSGATTGQPLEITNSSALSVQITAPEPGSFFDGASGVVDELTLVAKGTIRLVVIPNQYRVFSRYS